MSGFLLCRAGQDATGAQVRVAASSSKWLNPALAQRCRMSRMAFVRMDRRNPENDSEASALVPRCTRFRAVPRRPLAEARACAFASRRAAGFHPCTRAPFHLPLAHHGTRLICKWSNTESDSVPSVRKLELALGVASSTLALPGRSVAALRVQIRPSDAARRGRARAAARPASFASRPVVASSLNVTGQSGSRYRCSRST